MPRTLTASLLPALALLVLLPQAAQALPAITCHCFTDRTYDPSRPAVADPYFLATTQNSFFAAVFNVDRKTVVLKKQTGTSADGLWIAYGIAARAGTSPEELLRMRQRAPSWREALATLHLSARTTGGHVKQALEAMAPDSRIAEAVVDDIFGRYRLMGESELTALRKRGATNQELIVATMIGIRKHLPAEAVFTMAKGGSRSWGALLSDARIEPNDIPGEIGRMLNRARP